jgi:hypothetical protein
MKRDRMPVIAVALAVATLALAVLSGQQQATINGIPNQGVTMIAGEYPSWQICNPAGCGSETSNGYYAIMNPNGVTFDECAANLATAPTGSDVWVDVQDGNGTSIFSAGHIVLGNGSTTAVFSSAFTASPYTAAKGAKFRAAALQNDSSGVAQFAYVRCRVH